MRDWAFVRILGTLRDAFFASQRRKHVEARSQQLGTYFCSETKPPLVLGRSFALFYRSRAVWNLTQAVFFVALAYWTLRNYIAVIKSL